MNKIQLNEKQIAFPISRDPPEGGTVLYVVEVAVKGGSFQFLGIPPKGEPHPVSATTQTSWSFPISRDPPEGGTLFGFPGVYYILRSKRFQFLGIPPKGEQRVLNGGLRTPLRSFQFLGIPPKGELVTVVPVVLSVSSFQFLGIPPKGERAY